MIRILFILCSILLMHNLFAQKQKDYMPSDEAETIPRPYDYHKNDQYDGLKVYTGYITMPDGVRLAYDLYLPKKLEDGKKLPTLLHQTRYWRAPDLRWPFSMFSNGLIGRTGKLINDIVNNGYAIVNVDARGSGASFGSRAYPWTQEETEDGSSVIDWIIAQKWSDGNVGSLGVSYSGTTAEFLSFNEHPNLKAVLLMYSLYDVYDDIAYPGGIFHEFFVNNWGEFNAKLDRNKIPRGGFIVKLLVKGVRRVNGKKKVRTFHAALKDHEKNLQVDETAKGVEYRDQKPPGVDIQTIDAFSPFTYADQINNCSTGVYCYSGWWDGDYQHSNIKRFLNLTNPKNKLTLGPWEHGGKFNCSPENPGPTGFNHTGEFLKFFDYHLKGIENGLYDESRIHYFTMGEEKWESAETWPPKAISTPIYFSKENSLSWDKPMTEKAHDNYTVDTTVRTGDNTKWKSMIGMLDEPNGYSDRNIQDAKLLCYDSAPLENDLTISGHPIVSLFVKSDAPDGNFHVYLEEIEPDGSVNYITEGLLRGLHRNLNTAEPLYADCVPHRNYDSHDVNPLVPTEVAELIFDMIPTSYRFKKGNRIRIALAGADKSHFKVMFKGLPTWEVYRDQVRSSHIVLPVVK